MPTTVLTVSITLEEIRDHIQTSQVFREPADLAAWVASNRQFIRVCMQDEAMRAVDTYLIEDGHVIPAPGSGFWGDGDGA